MKVFSQSLSGSDSDPLKPLVITLHGWGASMYDLWDLSSHFPADWSWRFVQGSIDLGGGSAGWFPRDLRVFQSQDPMDYFHNLPGTLKEEFLSIGSYLIDLLAEDLKTPRPIVLAGFSQGAITALGLTLYSILPVSPAVVLAFSPAPWSGLEDELQRKSGNLVPPIFISHGSQDPILPFALTAEMARAFSAVSESFRFFPFSGFHEIPLPVIDQARRFCEKNLSGRKI